MMAPRHHGAMRHVAGPRVELGTRTIFNLLGPLANPAGVKRQIMGVFAAEWVEPLAQVLGRLGCERAWVVHGEGLDELTTTGTSIVAEWDGRAGAHLRGDAGRRRPAAGLARATSRAATPSTMPRPSGPCSSGVKGPFRDAVLLGAAGALVVADGRPACGRGPAWRPRRSTAMPPVQRLDRPGPHHQRGRRLMSDVLARIVERKREHVAPVDAGGSHARRCASGSQAASPPPRLCPRADLGSGRCRRACALIAEIKKASPSKGLIRADFDPPMLARAYAAGGAACLSVLTDDAVLPGAPTPTWPRPRGGGAAGRCARTSSSIPTRCSRPRAMGADCILLIMACLADAPGRASWRDAAHELGMDVLVEVHDAAELERALAVAGRSGRHQQPQSQDTGGRSGTRPRQLAPRVPADRLRGGRERPRRAMPTCCGCARAGARAFLVGKSLMRQADVTAATRRLLGLDRGVSDLTHFDAAGNAVMVDVGGKAVTERTATAAGRVGHGRRDPPPDRRARLQEGRRALGGAARRHHGRQADGRADPALPPARR